MRKIEFFFKKEIKQNHFILNLIGNWSSPPPICQAVQCPPLYLEDPHLSLTELNTSAWGRAVFKCSWGYRLSGPAALHCEPSGQWDNPVPRCSGNMNSILLYSFIGCLKFIHPLAKLNFSLYTQSFAFISSVSKTYFKVKWVKFNSETLFIFHFNLC